MGNDTRTTVFVNPSHTVALLDAVDDFTADLEDPTLEELDEHLRDEGIDPDTVVESVLSSYQEKLIPRR